MQLTTDRLQLRYVEADDWPRVMEIWEDFARSPYAGYDAPHDTAPSAVRERVRQWAEVSPQGEHMFFAVCRSEDLLGLIDLHKIPEGYACGYCFDSRYQGMGYARESLGALMDRLSGGGAAFTAGTALNNLPSVRLLKSLGFRQTGTERMSFYRDGEGNRIWFDGGIFTAVPEESPSGQR